MDERRFPYIAVLVAALARLPAFLLGVEHYGDAPVRIELAERWLAAPHLWRGFTEAFQFGPLQLSLVALALRIWPTRHWSPKLLSLFCGLLCVLLLYRLACRFVTKEAAFAAALALALSPLHIQASTTGASEAPFCALLLGCLVLVTDGFASGSGGLPAQPSPGRTVLAALILACAGLVRYDGWLYVPLLGALVYTRRHRFADAALFCAVSALPIPLWLWQNHVYANDALAPIHHIDKDHLQLAEMALRSMGPWGYRLYCAGYWPWAVLVVCTPVAGLLALVGSVRAIRRRSPGAALALLGFAPLAYFAFRSAVLADFRPIARFAVLSSTLLLPFAWDALMSLPSSLRKPVLALGCVLLVATPAGLALASYGRNGGIAEWARPISPISSVPPGIAQAVRFVRANARPEDVVLLDSAPHYLDIPLAFEIDLPESRLVRYRWPDAAGRAARTPPTLAVLLYQGTLRDDPLARGASEVSDRFAFATLEFCKLERFVYATVYRRCAGAALGKIAR